jgi:hypothetical protein
LENRAIPKMIRRFCGRREGARSRPVHLRSLRMHQIKQRGHIRSTSIPCRWPMVSGRQMTRFCASARPPMPFHTPGARRRFDRRFDDQQTREVPWEVSVFGRQCHLDVGADGRARGQTTGAAERATAKFFVRAGAVRAIGMEQTREFARRLCRRESSVEEVSTRRVVD